MMYIVTFLDDDNKLHVKNEIFETLEDAIKYASGVATGRKPCVWQYVDTKIQS